MALSESGVSLPDATKQISYQVSSLLHTALASDYQRDIVGIMTWEPDKRAL